MTAIGNFHYNSLSTSMKYDLWLLLAISFTIPYQHHWNMTYENYGPFQLQLLITIIEIWAMTAMGDFLYNFLSKSLKYDLWQLWAISITIPYQNHWNMTYDCYGQFPLQRFIKIIEMWPVTAMGYFLYNSLSKSLKYDLCKLWAISITTPYLNRWTMSYDS
jgi:hypothetical protein